MELLSPTALLSFFLLPLLLLPYLIRGRPRRFVFSSLLLLKAFAARSAGRPWGRLILPPLFFLQLLLLLLLILALAEPVFSVRPVKVAVVIDNSASMQALAGRRSRFEIARAEARAWVSGLSARARVDVYHTVPALDRVGEKGLTPDRTTALIDSLAPYDVADSQRDYGVELAGLVQNGGYEQLLFWTDHPAVGASRAVKVVSVGGPEANLSLTSFDLTRRSFVSSQWNATVTVANYSAKAQTVKLALKGGEDLLSSRTVSVAAGKSGQVSFEGLPFRNSYEAELQEKDALPLDNRRFAVPPAPGSLRILGISPRPEALNSLRSIPGVRIEVISPAAYAKSRSGEHALEIFHYSSPAVLPERHALFILPPGDNPMVSVGKVLSRPSISSWREPHRLTRYVNFMLLHPAYARVLRPRSFGDPVMESGDGPLAIASERQGFRYLALGFDPLPYLGEKNLPVSIFTLNLLGWFDEGLGKAAARTGEPLRLSGTEPRGIVVRTPRGEKFTLKESQGLFSQTSFQGIYQLSRGGRSEFRALNLESSGESDLRQPSRIQLRGEASRPGEPLSLMPLWPYLLFLSLLLLFLEWYLNPPIPSQR